MSILLAVFPDRDLYAGCYSERSYAVLDNMFMTTF